MNSSFALYITVIQYFHLTDILITPPPVYKCMSVTDFKNSFVRGTDAVDYNSKISKAEHLEAELNEITDEIDETEDSWERHELELAQHRVAGQLAGVLYELELMTEDEQEARDRGKMEDAMAEDEFHSHFR